MDKKKFIYAAAAIFVGLIYLSTYLVRVDSGNAGSGGSGVSTTVTTVPATVYAYGFANAIVSNFTQNIQFSVSCSSNESSAILNQLNSLFSQLQVNGSVINAYQVSSSVLVQSGAMQPRAIYSYITGQLNSSANSCVNAQGTAVLTLPYAVNMTYQGQGNLQHVEVPIAPNQRQQQFSLALNYTSNTLPVKIIGLLEDNGTIYQLNITKGA